MFLLEQVLFNKQRYEFFSKSQLKAMNNGEETRCCSISKDTNFSANHNYGEVLGKEFKGVVQ